MVRNPRKNSRLVEIGVYVTPKLLERIDTHLENIGLTNRSGWIRSALIRQLNEENA